VRFNEEEWDDIEKFAKDENITLNDAIRSGMRKALYGFESEKIIDDVATVVRTMRRARSEERV
jgi:hypothetical protein